MVLLACSNIYKLKFLLQVNPSHCNRIQLKQSHTPLQSYLPHHHPLHPHCLISLPSSSSTFPYSSIFACHHEIDVICDGVWGAHSVLLQKPGCHGISFVVYNIVLFVVNATSTSSHNTPKSRKTSA